MSVWSRSELAGLGSLPRNHSYSAGRLTRSTRASCDLFSESAACNSCICSITERVKASRKSPESSAAAVSESRSIGRNVSTQGLEPMRKENESQRASSEMMPPLPE